MRLRSASLVTVCAMLWALGLPALTYAEGTETAVANESTASASDKLAALTEMAGKIVANAKKRGQAAVVFVRQGSTGRPSIVIAIGEDAERIFLSYGDAEESRGPLPSARQAPPELVVPSSHKAAERKRSGEPTDASAPASEEEARSGPDSERNWFDLAAGFGILSRSFSYSASIGNSANLRAYDIPAMPLFEIGAVVYPAAGARSSYLHGLGAAAAFGHALSTESSTGGLSRFDTGGGRWRVGLVYGLPVVDGGRINIGFDYGQQHFEFEELTAEAAQIVSEAPSVHYEFVRPNLGGDYALGRLRLGATFAYLAVLEGGATYERFRDPSVYGIDLGAQVDFALPRGFGLRLTADYRRLFSSFDPEIGDEFVAGGALDQLITAQFGIRYAFAAAAH